MSSHRGHQSRSDRIEHLRLAQTSASAFCHNWFGSRGHHTECHFTARCTTTLHIQQAYCSSLTSPLFKSMSSISCLSSSCSLSTSSILFFTSSSSRRSAAEALFRSRLCVADPLSGFTVTALDACARYTARTSMTSRSSSGSSLTVACCCWCRGRTLDRETLELVSDGTP